VKHGESWAVVGPSGCGKTTLLYLLAGLHRPKSGEVLVEGDPVTGPRPSTGLILQDYGLLPWATAKDNIALGLRIRGIKARERDALAHHWLERLGIEAVANKYPGQLSGGQRQRVAIARTLILNPTLLLMDEPFSSLDSSTREDLQNLVVQLATDGSMTTVLVTHDIQEAAFLGRKVLVVGGAPISDGVVVDNPLARRPQYRHTPEFFAKCSELKTIALELVEGRPGVRRSLEVAG
jgi:NitT/TauT family transport system ATP-binding protein